MGREVDSPDMLECPLCEQYFHPVCVGVPVPEELPGYAKVWMGESCHKRPGMPPHPSLWYRVQQCFKKCGKRSTCTVCEADKAAGQCFRLAMQDKRRALPTTKEELPEAGKIYVKKWFKTNQQERYAACQSEHSSLTVKLTSSYLYPQVRRDGLEQRGGSRVTLQQSPARETRAEKLKARAPRARNCRNTK